MAEDGGQNYSKIIEKAASLTLLTFITRLPGQEPSDFFTWYEERHAPDFLGFAAPYMARYCRNFVVGATSEAGFDVITEFAYRSEADQAKVMKLLSEPASDALRQGPRGASKSVSVSVDESVIVGPKRGHDKVPTAKKAVLLKRPATVTADAFAAGARDYATALAKTLGGDAIRVVLDLARPDGAGAPLHDAIVVIWPKAGTLDASFAAMAGAPIIVANVLDLATYDAPLAG